MRQYLPMFPRTALVTGGASGIGAATADLLRSEGVVVHVLDLRDGFDVSDPGAWERVDTVELACLNAGVVTGERDVTRLTDAAYRISLSRRRNASSTWDWAVEMASVALAARYICRIPVVNIAMAADMTVIVTATSIMVAPPSPRVVIAGGSHLV